MRPYVVLRYNGFILLLNACFLLISSAISAFHEDSALFPLLYSAIVVALFGVFPLIYTPPAQEISNEEGLLIVVTSWLLSCLSGVIPYVLWGGEFTFTNAWFESVSGFTTTGSTVLTDIEALPLGLLFWRSATHWIGGIGIIIFALSLLPSMGKAGMLLYRSEMSPLAADNFRFRTKKTLKVLVVVYVGLTILETIALLICGMGLFDAVTHAFATIATGGFSPKTLNVAYFNSVSIEVVIMIFMVLSGMHFGLLFGAVCGDWKSLWKSSVARSYMLMMAIGVLITTISLRGGVYKNWPDALRYASFQLISLGTSTGFANADSALWPSLSVLVIIFFTLQCACAGSTSGGIKVDRFVLFWEALKIRIARIKHPHMVVTAKQNGAPVEAGVLEESVLYIVLYVAIIFFTSLLLTALGVDGLTAFTGSAATMGNAGPGFGTVSSLGNFSSIPAPGKWALSANMLIGRLEIFSILVLIKIRSWK
ncbi:MAG: TrkH family potassium uptake protein [Deltaproteobacteria bacterium]|nr:TrkH family potassium uptake protein [Deltaproteobacteria bacterium]